jgi:heat shock protein 1/8
MVREAEKFKNEDEAVRKRVESKNGLENYCYSIRTTIKDEKLKEKIAPEKDKLEKLVDETLKWVESNPNAHAEEFEKKQKEVEEIFNPIITKIYQETGGAGGMPGGMPGGFPGGAGGFPGGAGPTGGAGPKVDEVD